MTAQEIEKIKDLQGKGYGYRKIATETGISVNTVKSYCQRHPVGKESEKPLAAKHCLHCGEPLVLRYAVKEKRFCNDKCRLAWWNAHRSEVQRKTYHKKICPSCGIEFAVYGKKDQRFCSRACFGISRRKAVDE